MSRGARKPVARDSEYVPEIELYRHDCCSRGLAHYSHVLSEGSGVVFKSQSSGFKPHWDLVASLSKTHLNLNGLLVTRQIDNTSPGVRQEGN